MRSIVLLAALLAIGNSCHGAVLVRFINTVPTRTAGATTFPTLVATQGRIQSESLSVDRIGLQYSTAGQAPFVVWTEATNARSAEVSGGTPPYAFIHSMPPLRQYHKTDVDASVVLVDTVSTLKATDLPARYAAVSPQSVDNYEQTYLKADGVGLYLTFAAGTYSFQAYAVTSPITLAGASPRALTTSARDVTFVDGKVYSVIATGFGAYTATGLTGNTVALVVLEESVAPTTFGMASLRWFHAIRSQSTNTINVYQGSTSGTALVTGVAFGAASAYVDVMPASAASLPVTASGTTTTVITSANFAATHDVRAGLRATVICAQFDETTATVFCRMIPSRVVAYVRLVNDLAGQNNQVQGAFGATPLSKTLLTLWGSYEFPRPSQVVEGAQNLGAATVPTSALWSRGLYGVVSKVAANTCTGYGEAWVPTMYMDYAIRFVVARDEIDNPLFNGASNQVTPFGSTTNQWFLGAPIYKRVNFVVKTDGFSTLSGLGTNAGFANPAFVDTNQWYNNALLLDTYMEPGQYYTLIVTSSYADNVNGQAVRQIQTATTSSVRFFWRLDRTVDSVSSGSSLVANNKATITFVPFGSQDNTGNAINIRKVGATNININPPATAAATSAIAATTSFNAWNTPVIGATVDIGDYTFDQSGNADACTQKIPGSTPITFAAGDIYDVYVLNAVGCKIASTTGDASQLAITVCKTQSALVTNHAVATLLDGTAPAAPSTGFLSSSASAASSSVVVLMAALAAIVAALL